MPKRHYIIYCDESDKKGKYFSNFFGGVLLKTRDQEAIQSLLVEKKAELNLYREIKWQKVTENYLEKYIEFMSYFFSFVATSRLRVRIMFTQNIHRPIGLTKEQLDKQYFLLYYQFIKHAFGIKYSNPNALDRVYFSLVPDQIPDTKEKIEIFRNYLSQIPNSSSMRGSQVFIPREQINDVDSKDHVILQGLDVILGAMSARLNDKFKEKPLNRQTRGKRTIAKEKLYKHINKEIRNIYPRFNIGISTASQNGSADRWHHPYRHWCFVPKDYELNPKAKKGKPRNDLPE